MNEEPRQYFCDPLLDDPKLYDLPQWRSQRGAGGATAPGRNSAPPLAPQMKLHFVQRSMESRHFESQSAPTPPPRSPLSTPCRPLILKSLATPWTSPPGYLCIKKQVVTVYPRGHSFFFFAMGMCRHWDKVREQGAPLLGNDKENWENHHIDVVAICRGVFIVRPCSWGRNHFIHPCPGYVQHGFSKVGSTERIFCLKTRVLGTNFRQS